MKTKIFHDYVLHTRLVNNFYQSFGGGEGFVKQLFGTSDLKTRLSTS